MSNLSSAKHLVVDGEEIAADRAKTASQTDSKCPACNGILAFDPKSQRLKCPYCDSKYDFKDLQPGESVSSTSASTDDDKKPSSSSSKKIVPKHEERPLRLEDDDPNCDWGVQKKVITCKVCGASTIYDAVQTASNCPYCDSNHIIVEKDAKVIAPTGICPFKISKEQVHENFKKWAKDLWFAPSSFKKDVQTDSIVGFYLPYWTFDVDTETKYSMEYGIRNGDKTSWKRTSGTEKIFFDDYLMSASSQQRSKIFNEVAPFNTEDYEHYRPEYMAGFIAERYSVSVKASWKKAELEIKRDIRKEVSSRVRKRYNANSTRSEKLDIKMGEVSYKYMLLPIWHATSKYHGKTYQFMVNGQNGKVTGERPYSFWKILFAVMLGMFCLMCIIII